MPVDPIFFLFAFLTVGAVSLFGFLAVASWAGARQQERESYYRNDMLKKLADSNSSGAAATLEYLREQEQSAFARRAQKKREGYIAGGLINLAVGIGLMIFLRAMVRDEPAFYIGLIPGLIGVALIICGFLFGPRPSAIS